MKPGEEAEADKFWALNHYVSGGYDKRVSFELLNQEMSRHEKSAGGPANRLFYLALPPSVFETVTTHLKETCMSARGWSRIIVEKPFGKDLESSNKLSSHLASHLCRPNDIRQSSRPSS